MNFYDKETLTVIFRWLVILALLGWAVTAKLIIRLIGNKRLLRLFRRLYLSFVVVIIARIAASALDKFFDFDFSWCLSIVNLVFYLFGLYVLLKFYFRLRKDFREGQEFTVSPTRADKKKVINLFDELLDELRIQMEKQDEAEKLIKQHLT